MNFITHIRASNATRIFLILFALAFSTTAHCSLQQAISTLANPTTGSDDEIGKTIETSKILKPAEHLVLANRLRLREAALMIRKRQFPEARDVLKKIETASPSGAQAGLLIAESFRLEKNTVEARNWFLRTARHFPYRPQTLSGLISSANDQQMTNPGLALALYSEIETQSQFAQNQLETLKTNGQIDPLAIIFPSETDDDVRETLLKHCLYHPKLNLLRSTSTLQKSIRRLLQLQAQSRRLSEQLVGLTEELAGYQKERSQIEKALSSHSRQTESLKKQLIPNNFSVDQARLRQNLTQLTNQQTRLQAQIDFIDRSSQTLPAIIDKVRHQTRQLHSTAMAQLKTSHADVDAILNTSYQAYLTKLRNLAAEARLQRAEILLSGSR